MRPISLNLKGFKGIRSKSGKDEYSLDLTGFQGLVAIIGPNGAGKTTVLDNLHPFRIMPYRSGSYSPRSFSFYPECYGRDALKELVFEMDGNLYRSLILIDAEKKKQEAYLYIKNSDWQPLTDGKVDTYDKTITSLVGTPQMFFTSVFRCQEAIKLSDYTKGEIKDLFVELLNIENLKQIGVNAKESKTEMLKRLDLVISEVTRLKEDIKTAKESSREAKTYRKELKSIEKEFQAIDKMIEQKISELQEIKSKVAVYASNLKEKETIKADLDTITESIKKYQNITVKSEQIKAACESEKKLAVEIDILEKEYSEVESVITNLHKIFSAKKDIEASIAEKDKTLSELSLKRKHNCDAVRSDIEKAKNTKLLLDKVPCTSESHSKCLLLADAVRAKNSITVLVPRLHKLKGQTLAEKNIDQEIESLRKDMSTLKKTEGSLEVSSKKKDELKSKLAVNKEHIKQYSELSKLLPELELAERMLPDLQAKKVTLENKLASIKTDNSLTVKESEITVSIKSLQDDKKKSVNRTSELQQSLGSADALIRKGEASTQKLTDVNADIDHLKKEISEWAILDKAFSNDGIIALEIDDAGPSISAIANDLLYSCFGSRFSVRIDTQVAKSSGKGLKETFDLIILDSERKETKSLHSMSGGEKVWIEEAVTRAISLYNASKANVRYQTLFTDEKDGSLDHQKKKEFMAMKSEVLKLGKYDLELFISQSPEINEIADHTILVG